MSNTHWITVHTFSTPIEAHAARTFLEAEGIECFVRDEHTLGVSPHYALALGGARLAVKEKDARRAAKLLEAVHAAPSPARICPACGSTSLRSSDTGRKASAVLATLIASVPIPFVRARHRCGACGHEWRA